MMTTTKEIKHIENSSIEVLNSIEISLEKILVEESNQCLSSDINNMF